MDEPMDRRSFLETTGAVTVSAGFATAPVKAVEQTPSSDGPLVGVHYYPWFNMHAGHEDWLERTPANPVLGEYDSDDPDVIDQHLDWCLDHGIEWLSMSWWGPDSVEDEVLTTAIPTADRFDEIQYSILYETQGRLEPYEYDLDTPEAYDRFVADIDYLATQYFDDDNYLRFDDRPVVFVYVSNMLRGDVVGAIDAIESTIGERPYLLADLPFGVSADTYDISAVADGITTYNPYRALDDIETIFHDRFRQSTRILHASSDHVDRDFVPVAVPGYDDTHVRPGHPILDASPERYEQVCLDLDPHLDAARAVLITSFNEWYENTQIEPHEAVDDAYLELTAAHLTSASNDPFTVDGDTLELRFNRTAVPREVADGSTDDRHLALAISRIELRNDGSTVREYDIGSIVDEPLLLQGAYEPSGDRSFRWFGGLEHRAVIAVDIDLSTVDTAWVYCEPMLSSAIDAEVYVNGEQTDTVDFGVRHWRFDPVELSLSSAKETPTPSPTPTATPTRTPTPTPEETPHAIPTPSPEPSPPDADATPGFGIRTTIAAIGALGYGLARLVIGRDEAE